MQPTYAQSTTRPAAGSRIKKPSLDDMGPGTDRPIPRREAASGQAAAGPVARPRGGPAPQGADQPVSEESLPARDARIDSRAKAGAFGEKVKGPHKPTLDEMGPHASLSVPSGKTKVSDPSGLTPGRTSEQGVRPRGSDTQRPARTVEVLTEKEKRGRRGRPRKTGRPGH